MNTLLSKAHMKTLKKITLAYTLQVFAVIILFFFAGSSSAKKNKEPVTDIASPLLINKINSSAPSADSSFREKLTTLKQIFYTQRQVTLK